MIGTSMRCNDVRIKEIIEEKIADDFNGERNELRTKAKEQFQEIQEENRKSFNKKRKTPRRYSVNDLVTIAKTQFSTGAKLKTKDIGPYKVTKVKQNERYEVKKLETPMNRRKHQLQLIT